MPNEVAGALEWFVVVGIIAVVVGIIAGADAVEAAEPSFGVAVIAGIHGGENKAR